MKKNKLLVLISSIVLLIGLAACGGNNGGDKTNNGNKPTPATDNQQGNAVDAEAAESIYKTNCISCHAADLSGGAGPNLKKVGSYLSIEQITAKISNGGGGMPAYKGQLADKQIATLANWLATYK